MKNEIVSLSLSTDSIIAIIGIVVTVLIPVIGGIYKIVTSTKKYELTENYRKELLQWYTSVVEIMIRIIHSMESQEFFSDEFQPQKTEMLSRLSALTEIGRFYFPNVIKGDYFGHDKPSAYQGHRDICLEFLVYFYNTALKSVDDSNVSVLWKQERNFTALMFDVIEPRKRNRDYSKHLGLTIPKGQAIEDFIYENPKNINVFRS